MTGPDVTTAWREEWTRFAEIRQRHVIPDIEDFSDQLGGMEPAWREFLEPRDHLKRLAAWAEANPLANLPTDPSVLDLLTWPHDIPAPPEPPTPEHEHELRQECSEAIVVLDKLRASFRNPELGATIAGRPMILYASALTILGYALAVREVQQ